MNNRTSKTREGDIFSTLIMSQNGYQRSSNDLINDASSSDVFQSEYPDTGADLSSFQTFPEFPESDYPEELLGFLGINGSSDTLPQPQSGEGNLCNQNQINYSDLNNTGSFATLEQEIMSNLNFNEPTVSNGFSVRLEVLTNVPTRSDVTSVQNQDMLPQLGTCVALARENSLERELLNFLTLESTSGSSANRSLNFPDSQSFQTVKEHMTNGNTIEAQLDVVFNNEALSKAQNSNAASVVYGTVIQNREGDPVSNAAMEDLITDENIEETLQTLEAGDPDGISDNDVITEEKVKMEDYEVPQVQISSGAHTYLCPICGNQNGRHAHYGGYSCPSCRAFFRRSVQSKAFKTFNCKTGHCKINSKSWRSCKWCRYQKCLASGMKPEWVLDKSERHSRTEKRSISEVLGQDNSSLVQTLSIQTLKPSNFTNDELLQILSYVDCRKMNMSKSLLQFYSSNPFLFRELASAIYKKHIIPFSTYKHLENKWPCTMEDFVIKDSELGALSDLDSQTLLQANFPLLQIFIQSVIMMNNQHFKATPLANILKRSITVSPMEDEKQNVEVLSDVLKDLKIDCKNNQATTGLTYSQVFSSPWAESRELEERHAQLTKEISSWPVNPKDPAKHVDKVQLFLLANIIMLSTDNVTVTDYSKVTLIQEKYMSMLHRYLKYKYREKYNSVFAKGLMITSLALEAKEIRGHRLPV